LHLGKQLLQPVAAVMVSQLPVMPYFHKALGQNVLFEEAYKFRYGYASLLVHIVRAARMIILVLESDGFFCGIYVHIWCGLPQVCFGVW
jgi:hypothetical protein